jgi:hypothetical protein
VNWIGLGCWAFSVDNAQKIKEIYASFLFYQILVLRFFFNQIRERNSVIQ